MKKSMRGVAEAIVQELDGKTPKQVEEHMKDVVRYLAEHGFLTRWRDVEREIHEVWRRKYGASKVTIASAHPLNTKTAEALEKAAAGAEVVTVVDPRLLGGAVVRIDERRIDGSILGALSRLKQTLLS